MQRIKETIQNSAIHAQRFMVRTELGGMLNYRGANFEELDSLVNIYMECLLSNKIEKDGITSEQKDIEKKSVPKIIEIDYEKKRPKATQREIDNCFIFEAPREITVLTNDCVSIIKFVKDSVDSRRATGNMYEQGNSPIVIFCAELSLWLIDLAKRPIERSVYTDVVKRLEYLEAVLEKPVFADETNNDYAIQTVIFNVIEMIEKKVLPNILAKIKYLSAREHFDNLKIRSDAYINHIINALFYLYSEAEKVTIFDVRYYQIINNKELNNILDNRLGDSFKMLTNSSELYINTNNNVNLFLEDDGTPRKELVRRFENYEADKNDRPLGIHKVMNEEILIIHLIQQLGYLNDFWLLLIAFRQAFELAGSGGDYLLYIALSQETQSLLSAFYELINRTEKGLKTIEELSHKMYKEFVLTAVEQTWRRHFLTFKKTYRLANNDLNESRESLMAILKDMNATASLGYEESLKDKIINFRETVRIISSRSQNLTNTLTSVTCQTDFSLTKNEKYNDSIPIILPDTSLDNIKRTSLIDYNLTSDKDKQIHDLLKQAKETSLRFHNRQRPALMDESSDRKSTKKTKDTPKSFLFSKNDQSELSKSRTLTQHARQPTTHDYTEQNFDSAELEGKHEDHPGSFPENQSGKRTTLS